MPKYISLFERQIETLLRGSNICLADPGYVTNLRVVCLVILLNRFLNDTVVPFFFIIKYMAFF